MTKHVEETRCGLTQEDFFGPDDTEVCADGGTVFDHPSERAANIDQQDCPNYLDDDLEVPCEWTGNVMRYALDGVDTENGYEWTCPRCGQTSTWEGPDE